MKKKKVFKNETKALEACFDLWLWLALNPNMFKYEASIWKRNGGWLTYCRADCPCCEYASNRIVTEYCPNCPIKWPGSRCQSDKSPFWKWEQTLSLSDRTKYALEICVLSLEAIERIQNEHY